MRGSSPPSSAERDRLLKMAFRLTQVRHKSFVRNLIENLRHEFERNKDMKDSLNKFRAEAQRLEESDALKAARDKFTKINKESETLKEGIERLKDSQGIKATMESISRAKTAAARVSHSVSQVQLIRDLDDGMYRRPKELRLRKSHSSMTNDDITSDTQTTTIDLHKDSRWSQSWTQLKDNNPLLSSFLARVSDSALFRSLARVVQKNEMSAVLTEIARMEPDFDRQVFLEWIERDMIPNVLEALIQGNLEVLQDWTYEGAFNLMSQPIKSVKEKGHFLDNRVLDLSNVDIAFGKLVDQGPVLVVTFQTQQVMVVRDKHGSVVDGDPDKVLRMSHVWVVCRDMNEVDCRAAWRVLEMAVSSSQLI